MRITTILIKRELSSAAMSCMLYITLLLFVSIYGFYNWMSEANVFNLGQASMVPFFNTIKWEFLFLIPAIAMRSFTEEQQNGTLELLLTKPISVNQLLGGKYLSQFIIVLFMLLLTLPSYFTVRSLGDVDPGQMMSGYLGLLLLGSFYISISTFASALASMSAKTTLCALLLSLGLILCFQFFFEWLAGFHQIGILADLFLFLSINEHLASLIWGVIDLRDIIYFLSMIIVFLVSAQTVLLKHRS